MLPIQALSEIVVRTLAAWTALAPLAPPQSATEAEPGAVPALPPTLSWVDFDADGLPDLYVAQPGGDRLLANLGGGMFEERIALTGLDQGGGSQLALWADYDGDRLPDVYRVGVDRSAGLWRNMGDGTFAEVSEFVGLARAEGVLGARWIDVDGDLSPDLEVLSLRGASVYRNAGGTAFEPVLSLPARAAPGVVAGAAEEVAAAREEPRAGESPSGSRIAVTTAGAGLAGASSAGTRTRATASGFCAFGVQDQAIAGACITASSVPGLGQLYPLSNNLYVALSGNVGIGTVTPSSELDVIGKTRTEVLQVTGGATSGHLLTSDSSGNASWQPAPGVGGSGSAGYVPHFTGPTTLGSSAIYDDGGRVGIGVNDPEFSTLHLKSWLTDSSLRLEGTGAGGMGGRVVFGDVGQTTYIEEYEDDGLYLVAPTGIALGPGNVGIHTGTLADATHALTISYKDLSQHGILRLIGPDGSYGYGARLNFGDGNYVTLEEDTDDHLRISASGGTKVEKDSFSDTPALEVVQTLGSGTSSPALKVENTSTSQGIGVFSETWGSDANAVFTQHGTGHVIKGFVGGQLKFEVRNDGRMVARSVEITGGSDLVEAFDSDVAVEPGTVMCIDPERPGQLTPSRTTYDARVAGVVSGAGGVEPGLHLRQEGVVDGDVLVAMAGRVYVRCSAENGGIRPGDLLTTATLAGHAMRASDSERSFGAVIGKAMTELDEGTGLVLVLVNLQ